MPYYEANIGYHKSIIETWKRRILGTVFLHESSLEFSAHMQFFIPRAKLGFLACSRFIFIRIADCFGLKTVLNMLIHHMRFIILHMGVVEEDSSRWIPFFVSLVVVESLLLHFACIESFFLEFARGESLPSSLCSRRRLHLLHRHLTHEREKCVCGCVLLLGYGYGVLKLHERGEAKHSSQPTPAREGKGFFYRAGRGREREGEDLMPSVGCQQKCAILMVGGERVVESSPYKRGSELELSLVKPKSCYAW